LGRPGFFPVLDGSFTLKLEMPKATGDRHWEPCPRRFPKKIPPAINPLSGPFPRAHPCMQPHGFQFAGSKPAMGEAAGSEEGCAPSLPHRSGRRRDITIRPPPARGGRRFKRIRKPAPPPDSLRGPPTLLSSKGAAALGKLGVGFIRNLRMELREFGVHAQQKQCWRPLPHK
jgi:hypothetical protein